MRQRSAGTAKVRTFESIERAIWILGYTPTRLMIYYQWNPVIPLLSVIRL